MSFPQGQPPFAQTPMTDVAAKLGLADIQLSQPKQCRRFEMKYFDCLEAYGLENGYIKCADYYDDLLECKHSHKQTHRMFLMRRELEKQVKEGKRSYVKAPEIDAYSQPDFGMA